MRLEATDLKTTRDAPAEAPTSEPAPAVESRSPTSNARAVAEVSRGALGATTFAPGTVPSGCSETALRGAASLSSAEIKRLAGVAESMSHEEIVARCNQWLERMAQASASAAHAPVEKAFAPVSELAHRILHRDAPRFVGSDIGNELRRAGAAVTGVVVAMSAAYMAFEGHNVSDALHLALQTVTTVGYGDVPPKTDLGRAAN